MNRKQRSRGTKTDMKTKSYRSDYIRKKMLQKALKPHEKGFKILERLSESIHTGLEVLWRQGVLCDVDVVSTDRRHFKAHKIVLATCCDYFYDLLADPEAEEDGVVEVSEVRGDVLDLILEAMYTGRVKIEAGNVDDLLVAANTLGMYLVVDACEEFLLEKVTKENCLQLLATSFKYNLSRLTESALNMAASCFLTVSKSTAFRNLPVEHLIPLLKRDDLNVNNELEVFHRARQWLEENRNSRLHQAADVLATIRLPLLTPAAIVDNVECWTQLMEVNGCQRLVKEALHYHLMPSRQCLLQSPRTVPRRKATTCLVVVGGAPRLTFDPVNDKVIRYNAVRNRWEDVTSLPEPRHHHAVAALNGFLYVAGGEAANDSSSCSPVSSVHRFDPRSGEWRPVASMLHCRQSFQLCAMNSVLYAVGGRASNEELLDVVERYDPALDRWEEVAPLSVARRCVAVAGLAGKMYAVGGSSMKAVSSRAERYSPLENRWELVRPTNVPRFFGHLHTVAPNFLYLLGGAAIDGSGNVMCVDTIERYSSTNNQWNIISRMRTPRSEAGCALIKDKIYVVGGYNWNANERICQVEAFDTDTESWISLPNLDRPLTGVAAVALQLYDDFNPKQGDLTNNCIKEDKFIFGMKGMTSKLGNTSCACKSVAKDGVKDKTIPKDNKQSTSRAKGESKEKISQAEDKPSTSSTFSAKEQCESDKTNANQPAEGTETPIPSRSLTVMTEENQNDIDAVLTRKTATGKDKKHSVPPCVAKKEGHVSVGSSATKPSSVEGLVDGSAGHSDISNNCDTGHVNWPHYELSQHLQEQMDKKSSDSEKK